MAQLPETTQNGCREAPDPAAEGSGEGGRAEAGVNQRTGKEEEATRPQTSAPGARSSPAVGWRPGFARQSIIVTIKQNTGTPGLGGHLTLCELALQREAGKTPRGGDRGAEEMGLRTGLEGEGVDTATCPGRTQAGGRFSAPVGRCGMKQVAPSDPALLTSRLESGRLQF